MVTSTHNTEYKWSLLSVWPYEEEKSFMYKSVKHKVTIKKSK